MPVQWVEGPIDGVVVAALAVRADARGWLVELFRTDELPAAHQPVMAYVSETLPGVVRGPHEHQQQADLFAMIGPGEFTIHLWDPRPASPTCGRRMTLLAGQDAPRSVLVPPGVVHGYKNTGRVPGWVINAPNRLYAGVGRRESVDEIRHEQCADSPYVIE